MNSSSIVNYHIPVLLHKAINFLPNKKKLNVIDATFGGGGYSKFILKKKRFVNLIAIDRDPEAKVFIKDIGKKKNFKLLGGNFKNIDSLVMSHMKINKLLGFDAIIFDLGLSSNQLEDYKRGFSFNKNGPLDMRMDKKGLSAYDLLNTFSENEISKIIFKYGEERFARLIAKKIVQYRKIEQIKNTFDLSTIINKSVKVKNKKYYKINPATKTFQALRIFINNEIENLKEALKKAVKLLLPGGKIIIVSFHSLEDKIVKEFFNHNSGKKWRSSRHYPEPIDVGPMTLRIITKKAIRPDEAEIITNPRSRSARLRVAEKLMEKKVRDEF